MSVTSEHGTSLIHPTAIIDPLAEIDPTVEIGPNVIIEGPVRIGARTRLMANCYIAGETTIGCDNQIFVGCVIGLAPQHLHFKPEFKCGVVVGDSNVLREYVTIHQASIDGTNTTVGSHNFLMANCHVAHDAVVGSHTIMANGTLLAGHTVVEDRAVLSGLVAVHQHARIGRLAMIGGLSKIVKDVPPFMTVDGSAICGINTVGLRRAGMGPQTREKIKQAYKILYRMRSSVPNALARLEEELGMCPEVRHIIDFVRGSIRGISKQVRRQPEQDD